MQPGLDRSLVSGLPLQDSVIKPRPAMAVTPAVAVLVAVVIADALRQTVTALLGGRPGEKHGDTWVWDVRDLVPASREYANVWCRTR